MTIFTRDFNRNSSYWTAILFYLICGLLLLLMPNLALSIANVALAILLCAVGVRSIVSYLRGSILDGVMGLQLAAGLVALCFALLLLFNPLFLAELLPFVWGVALLVGGFGKVQMAADLKRIGDRFWWYALIAALWARWPLPGPYSSPLSLPSSWALPCWWKACWIWFPS